MLTICLIYCLIIYIIKIIVNLSIRSLAVVQILPMQQKGLALLPFFQLLSQLLSELRACQKYYFWNESCTLGPGIIISCVPNTASLVFKDGRLESVQSSMHRMDPVIVEENPTYILSFYTKKAFWDRMNTAWWCVQIAEPEREALALVPGEQL